MSDTGTIVISLGGSLIVPDTIDTELLSNFKQFVEESIAEGKRVVVIAGGGKTTRRYQEAAAHVATLTDDDLDWLGIHATRLNAHLIRTILRDVAHPVIITNPDDVLDIPDSARVIVAAGYRPGSSTDLRAVQIASHLGATKLINLSNIDYAYTDDPRTNPNAQKITETTWAEFRAILPTEWSPGLSSPFDPVAAREAEKNAIEVAIINGKQLDELRKYLKGEAFIGSVIR